jgi:hypothetical protein
MVLPTILRTEGVSQPSEGYCVAWDRNISVPFSYYPATSRINDTISIVRMIAFRGSRKRPVPYCEMALLITKPFVHVNIFLGFGILFRIAVFFGLTFGTAQVFAAAKVLKLTECYMLLFPASFRGFPIIHVRTPQAVILPRTISPPAG